MIIPTFRNFEQLSCCLCTLFTYTDPHPLVIVADNGETVDDWTRVVSLLSKFPDRWDISLCKMNGNVRDGVAVNRCSVGVTTEFLAMLNDDVVFLPGFPRFWLDLLSPLDMGEAEACGPCLDQDSGLAQNIEAHWMGSGISTEVGFLHGGCVAWSTVLFREMGGFDETLPGYIDVDFSMRLFFGGKRQVVNRSLYLKHLCSQTLSRVETDVQAWHRASREALSSKHGQDKVDEFNKFHYEQCCRVRLSS